MASDRWRRECQTMKPQRFVAGLATLLLSFSCMAAQSSPGPITIDLHPDGFPTAANLDPYRIDAFYVSSNRLGVFFEIEPAGSNSEGHKFRIMLFDAKGQKTAETTVPGDPKALEIIGGPDESVMVGQAGRLDFYDSHLQLARSVPLDPKTTGVAFNRYNNQLILQTMDRQAGVRAAEFLDANTLEKVRIPGISCQGARSIWERPVGVHGWRKLRGGGACSSRQIPLALSR